MVFTFWFSSLSPCLTMSTIACIQKGSESTAVPDACNVRNTSPVDSQERLHLAATDRVKADGQAGIARFQLPQKGCGQQTFRCGRTAQPIWMAICWTILIPVCRACQLFLLIQTAFRKGNSAGMPSACATTEKALAVVFRTYLQPQARMSAADIFAHIGM